MYTPFTPAPTRTDEATPTSRIPPGSLLFPSSNLGKSPLMTTASPAAHVPFTLGMGLDAHMGGGAPASQARGTGTSGAAQPFSLTPNFANTFSRTPHHPATSASSATTPAAPRTRTHAPPLQSLLDVAGTPSAPGLASAAGAPTSAAASASSAAAAPSAAAMPSAAAAFASSASAASGDLWVTAFGFSGTAMVPHVLEELRPSGGEIREHRLGSGLWVHVRYADWRQQQQALAKNGKVMHGMMLGVIAGVHPSTDSLDASASAFASAGSTATVGGGLAMSSIPLRVQQHRHLGPSLRAPAIAAADVGKAGWWTRLCEYVFGW